MIKITNDTSTLNGSLLEMKDQLISELADKGVTATYDSSTGLLGLIHKISDIAPSVGGITPVVTIDISKTPSTGTIYAGDTVIIECKVNADYDDESVVDIDLHGYLQGATLTIKNSGTTLGTAVSDSNGVATYTISNIQEGNYSITAHFDGTGTDYESATSTALTFTVEADPILFFDACNSATGLTNYGEPVLGGNAVTSMTYNSTENAYQIQLTTATTGGQESLIIPITPMSNTENFKVTADFKNNGSNDHYQVGLTFFKANDLTSNILVARIWTNRMQVVNENPNGGIVQPVPVNTQISNYTPDWYTFEITKNGTSMTLRLWKTSTPETILINETFSNSINWNSLGIHSIPTVTEVKGYVKNIKVESLE